MAATGHQPRRRFGQNFLVDDNMLAAMVRLVAPAPGQRLLEIGPGQGALTAGLIAGLGAAGALYAVEVDRDLAAALRAHWPDLHLIEADVLKLDLPALLGPADSPPWRVVGNLPYNISTPLLMALLAQCARIADMHFLLQQEVVDRLAASPGSKQWGRLSVMTQYHCDVQPLLAVPPSCFRPAPKVDSRFVRLVPKAQRPLSAPGMALFDAVLRAAFQQRRKTLRNALRAFDIPWPAAPVAAGLRPDQLGLPEYLALTEFLLVLNHERNGNIDPGKC